MRTSQRETYRTASGMAEFELTRQLCILYQASQREHRVPGAGFSRTDRDRGARLYEELVQHGGWTEPNWMLAAKLVGKYRGQFSQGDEDDQEKPDDVRAGVPAAPPAAAGYGDTEPAPEPETVGLDSADASGRVPASGEGPEDRDRGTGDGHEQHADTRDCEAMSRPAEQVEPAEAAELGVLPSLLEIRSVTGVPQVTAAIDPILRTYPDAPSTDPADWTIADCSWTIRMLRQIRRDRKLELSAFAVEIDQLTSALAELDLQHDQTEAQFLGALERYLKAHPPAGNKRSYRLPGGVIGRRWSRDQIAVRDQATAVAWAKQHLPPEALKIEARRSHLLAHMKQTGELAHGCDLVPGEDHFYCDTDSPLEGEAPNHGST